MKKLGTGIVAGAALMLLTACFSFQSFGVVDYTLSPGQSTKAKLVLRPWDVADPTSDLQFIVVGVPTGGDLAIGKATWGTNGTFGGPLAMNVSAGFAAAMSSSGDCAASGLDFASISGESWKAFLTPHRINDRGKVEKQMVAQVAIKATAGAGTGTNYTVFGVAGRYQDDGDGMVDSGDSFQCWGISTSSIFVKG
jgi:hypothetical protein